MKFKLKDIKPNPFRQGGTNQAKVNALVESIQTTEFWDNIVARIGADGSPQLAYGHHRLAALKQVYPPDHEISLIVRELDDATMLQIMARENMEDFNSDFLTLLHNVRVTVKAYAEGKIPPEKMPEPTADTRWIRLAPSFSIRAGSIKQLIDSGLPVAGRRPYTTDSIARFLGLTRSNGANQPPKSQESVSYAVQALELIEQGYLSEAALEGKRLIDIQAVIKAAQDKRELAAKQAREAVAQRQRAAEFKAKADELERKRKEADERYRVERQKQAKQEAKKEAEQIAEQQAKVAVKVEAAEKAAAAHETKAAQIQEAARQTIMLTPSPKPGEKNEKVSIGTLVGIVTDQVNRILNRDYLSRQIKEVGERQKEATQEQMALVVTSLEALIERVQTLLQEEL